MTMLTIDISWVGGFIGFLLGWAVHAALSVRTKYDGAIVIDDTAAEKTSWTLRVDGDPYKIPEKKHICLKVENVGNTIQC